jgi:hypothetical protein
MIKVLVRLAGKYSGGTSKSYVAEKIIQAVSRVEGYEEAEVNVLLSDERIISSRERENITLITIERWYSDTLPPSVTRNGQNPANPDKLGATIGQEVNDGISGYRSGRHSVQVRLLPFKRTSDEWVEIEV